MARDISTRGVKYNKNMDKYLEDLVEKKKGWWQIIVLINMSLIQFLCAPQHLAMPFYAPSVSHWCSKPKHLQKLPTQLWKNYSIPIENIESGKMIFSSCKTFDINYDNVTVDDYTSFMTDSRELNGNTSEKICSSWSYNRIEWKETIVFDWNLVCDKSVFVSVTSSMYMAGMCFGLMILPQISDRIGRKPVLLGCLIIWFACSLGLAFVQNFIVFTVLRFVIAAVDITSLAVIFIIGQESLNERSRVTLGNFTQSTFPLGVAFITMVTYFLRNWRLTQIIISIPVAFSFLLQLKIPESARWQLSVGRYTSGLKSLKACAKLNGYNLPDADVLQKETENLKCDKEDEIVETDKKKEATILDLFKTPNLRIRTLISYFLWFTVAFCYFAFTLNMEDMAGDFFLNMIISSSLEFCGVLIVTLLLMKVGRRLPTSFLLIFAGITLLLSIPVPTELTWLKIALSLLGRTSISMVFPIIYIHTAEYMPTVARSVGLGSCSMFARFGAIISPYTHEIKERSSGAVVFVMYGTLCILCGLSVLRLPETLDQVLPESIEDAENYQCQNKKIFRNPWKKRKTGNEDATFTQL